MTRARRLVAAGALAAFVAGGVSMAAGIGTASAATRDEPNTAATCLLPILPCEIQPSLAVPDLPIPNLLDSRSSGPAPTTRGRRRPMSRSPRRSPTVRGSRSTKRNTGCRRAIPRRARAGLVPEPPVWPFAAGGVALLAGAGLTGFAVRRGKGDTDAERMAQGAGGTGGEGRS